MYYPHMKNKENNTRQTVTAFGGYNHNEVIRENEFYGMANMTSDAYPALAVRPPRQYSKELVGWECSAWADGKKILLMKHTLNIDGVPVLTEELDGEEGHRLVVMGTYVIVFPEGLYVNVRNTKDKGRLDRRTAMTPCGSKVCVAVYNCDEDGNARSFAGEVDELPQITEVETAAELPQIMPVAEEAPEVKVVDNLDDVPDVIKYSYGALPPYAGSGDQAGGGVKFEESELPKDMIPYKTVRDLTMLAYDDLPETAEEGTWIYCKSENTVYIRYGYQWFDRGLYACDYGGDDPGHERIYRYDGENWVMTEPYWYLETDGRVYRYSDGKWMVQNFPVYWYHTGENAAYQFSQGEWVDVSPYWFLNVISEGRYEVFELTADGWENIPRYYYCLADGKLYDAVRKSVPMDPYWYNKKNGTTLRYDCKENDCEKNDCEKNDCEENAWKDASYWYCRADEKIYTRGANGWLGRTKLHWYVPGEKTAYRYTKDGWLASGYSYVLVRQDDGSLKSNADTRAWVQHLKPNDYVELTGLDDMAPDAAGFLNGKHVLRAVRHDVGGLVIQGYVYAVSGAVYNEGTGLPTVRFVIPYVDHVIACDNRLWGCRYGLSVDGQFVNEIYATALGDMSRWHTYSDGGYADNAWTAGVSHMGEFTGAVTYGGRPYFFKADRIYSVYGTDPSSFGYNELVEKGVQAGSDRSLCVVDGTLYYKAADDVVAFNGSYTTAVSDALGRVRYGKAVGGGIHGKYYVSMQSTDGAYHLFVYDTRRGMWHREDMGEVMAFATDQEDRLVCVEKTENQAGAGREVILAPEGAFEPNELPVKWMVETGPLGLDEPDTKYVSRLSIRLSMNMGDWVEVYVQYDSMGAFEPILVYEGQTTETPTLPIIPRRCDHLRLRICGTGGVRIYAITKTIEQGSDVVWRG